MNLNFTFRNQEQENFFWHTERNGRFGGGFGNGKTYVACQRAFVHLATFPSYRMAICRRTFKELKATTMQTFFKICPKEFIYSHDNQNGITVLVNNSVIYWLHLDNFDEQSLRGLEVNSVLIDQAEEVSEAIYLVLDFRVGRWDQAEVPAHLIESARLSGQEWPKHLVYGNYLVPNYMDILDNPTEDDEFHWIYQRFDLASLTKVQDHFSITRPTDESMNDFRTLEQIKLRDPEWLDKYFYGKTGISKARIHKIPNEAIIDPDTLTEEEFVALIRLVKRGAIYRVLDHGESSPTCCNFYSAVNNIHIQFGEYYMPNTLISDHRQNIFDISLELVSEELIDTFTDLIDPDCERKHTQKHGKQWSVMDEYAETEEITAPAFFWQPADNNELATRNRINELLRLQPKWMHPVTKLSPSTGIYFIKKSQKWPYGVHHTIVQTNSQRRQLLGSDNGKSIYSDDRAEGVVDHAYDPLRYYVAAHNSSRPQEMRKAPRRSFHTFNKIRKQLKENVYSMIN